MSEKLPPPPDLGPEWTAHWANRVHGQMQAYALAAIEAHEARKDLIRFCPECGHLGEVSVGARDCCPDGSHAAYMPRKTADKCARLFRDLLASAHPAPAQQPLSEEQEPNGWQPIETAPKNGFLLLLCTDGGIIFVGKFNKHLHLWVDDEGRERFRTVRYWMPLPITPSAERAHGIGSEIPIAKPSRSAQQ